MIEALISGEIFTDILFPAISCVGNAHLFPEKNHLTVAPFDNYSAILISGYLSTLWICGRITWTAFASTHEMELITVGIAITTRRRIPIPSITFYALAIK